MNTQPQVEDIIDIEEQYQVATYKKFPFVVERGKDVWVYTSDGDKYLDLYGGHAVVSTGHSHPRIVQAIADQAERLIFYSNLVYNDARARAAKKLVEAAPQLRRFDLTTQPQIENIIDRRTVSGRNLQEIPFVASAAKTYGFIQATVINISISTAATR